MLFTRFGINYNTIPERYRKGSVLVREEASVSRTVSSAPPLTCVSTQIPNSSDTSSLDTSNISGDHAPVTNATPLEDVPDAETGMTRSKKTKRRTQVTLYHCDIIDDSFWEARRYLLQ